MSDPQTPARAGTASPARAETDIIGEATDHGELLAVLRAWVKQLDMSYDGLDKLAGLPDRYANKLLRPIPIKGLNRYSMGPILGALGLKLLVVVNTAQLERLEWRKTQLGITPNQWTENRKVTEKRKAANDTQPTMRRHANWAQRNLTGNSDWGRMMRMRAIVLMTPKALQRSARKAGKARARQRRKIREALGSK